MGLLIFFLTLVIYISKILTKNSTDKSKNHKEGALYGNDGIISEYLF
jgi:hypothetical protein